MGDSNVVGIDSMILQVTAIDGDPVLLRNRCLRHFKEARGEPLAPDRRLPGPVHRPDRRSRLSLCNSGRDV